ncbi:hypothetical protein ACFE04_028358 [Oxalis oulophora]
MELQTPSNKTTNPNPKPNPFTDTQMAAAYYEEEDNINIIDSNCSTPYVSAPSSPAGCSGGPRPGPGPGSGNVGGGGFFYSAPTSPMHFAMNINKNTTTTTTTISSVSASCSPDNLHNSHGYEFEFSARFGSTESGQTGSMSSADELFLNGKIRPMKLSSHLERPQVLAPLLDLEDEEKEKKNMTSRGRDLKLRDKSLRRRTRSMSPLRSTSSFEWINEALENNIKNPNNKVNENTTTFKHDESMMMIPSDSRSSSASRSSKRWVFLPDFLYRSKSDGRVNNSSSNNNKFWSFSPAKDKKLQQEQEKFATLPKNQININNGNCKSKFVNGSVGKRRIRPPSPHELHYTTKRAQAEEMRKKTFLPYRNGLFGCLRLSSSKGYGAVNGFARALNPVSSR